MSALHTPGSWRVKGTRVYPGTGIDCICTMQVSNQPAWEEDVRLIAASPDLLEALKLADCLLSGANMNRTVVERTVRAAIAKATGATE